MMYVLSFLQNNHDCHERHESSKRVPESAKSDLQGTLPTCSWTYLPTEVPTLTSNFLPSFRDTTFAVQYTPPAPLHRCTAQRAAFRFPLSALLALVP